MAVAGSEWWWCSAAGRVTSRYAVFGAVDSREVVDVHGGGVIWRSSPSLSLFFFLGFGGGDTPRVMEKRIRVEINGL